MVTTQDFHMPREIGNVYEGEDLTYVDAVSRLRSAGHRALAVCDILEEQLVELRQFAQKYEGKRWSQWKFELECPLNTHHFDTADGIVYLDDQNKLMLIYDAEVLHNLTPLVPVVDESGVYFNENHATNSYVFASDELQELEKRGLLNKRLTEKQVVDGDYVHLGWNAMARGDSNLVRELASLKFKALRDIYEVEEGMGFIAYHERCRPHLLRDVLLAGIPDGADAVGLGHLNGGGARLVGILLECLKREFPSAELKPVLPYTREDLTAARLQLGQLRTILGEDKVKSIDALLQKL